MEYILDRGERLWGAEFWGGGLEKDAPMQLRDYWMPPSLSPAGSLDVWVYRHEQVKGWWWWWWMRKKVLSGRCVNHKVKALDPVYGTAAEEAIWGAWGLKNKVSGRVLSWHVWVSTSVFATGRFNKEGESEGRRRGGGHSVGFLETCLVYAH